MTQQPGSSGRTNGDRVIIGRSPEADAVYGDRYEDREVTRGQHAYADARYVPEETHERVTVVGRGSRLRGGPVLGGFVIGFATWILLELALFALDLGALAASVVPSADSSTWWWSGLAAVIGFFIGGLVAGASLPTRRVDDGILNGIAMWAVTVVSLVVMSALGAGIGFGVVGDVLATSSSLADADASVINDAQSAAAAALLALTVTLAAAAIGGALGSKMWPGEHDATIDLRH
jgi:hypothetical protein